jgi:hypothetical protein
MKHELGQTSTIQGGRDVREAGRDCFVGRPHQEMRKSQVEAQLVDALISCGCQPRCTMHSHSAETSWGLDATIDRAWDLLAPSYSSRQESRSNPSLRTSGWYGGSQWPPKIPQSVALLQTSDGSATITLRLGDLYGRRNRMAGISEISEYQFRVT